MHEKQKAAEARRREREKQAEERLVARPAVAMAAPEAGADGAAPSSAGDNSEPR